MSGSDRFGEIPRGVSSMLGTVVVFYLVMVGIALLVGPLFDIHPMLRTKGPLIAVWQELFLGLVYALLVVVGSHILDRVSRSFRGLSQLMAALIGPISLSGVVVLAVSSAIGEEIFFRGFLQQLFEARVFNALPYPAVFAIGVTSLIFGLLHQGPDPKVFWPWTVFASVVGIGLGALYELTGSIWPPIIAHGVINFLNLLTLVEPKS